MEWKCQIESIGVKTPEKRLTTIDLTGEIKIPCLRKFALLTGISERRICSSGEDSFSLAIDAARNCMSYSKYRADELDMIINCSITKYKGGLSHIYEPSFSILIRSLLGASRARAFDISNACAGMLTGLYIAEQFIRQGVIKTCMIVSGEYISNLSDHAIKNIRLSSLSEMSSLTLGDCGAAAIIERTSDERKALIISGFTTLSRFSNLCIGRQNRNSPGGNMKTKARKIHYAAITESVPIVREALKKCSLSMNEIKWLIPHQTSKSSITSGANHYLKSFGDKPGHIVITLKDTGNTASTTHFLSLYRYLNEKKFSEDDSIMLLCFASGLVIGVVIFRMNNMVFKYGNAD